LFLGRGENLEMLGDLDSIEISKEIEGTGEDNFKILKKLF